LNFVELLLLKKSRSPLTNKDTYCRLQKSERDLWERLSSRDQTPQIQQMVSWLKATPTSPVDRQMPNSYIALIKLTATIVMLKDQLM